MVTLQWREGSPSHRHKTTLVSNLENHFEVVISYRSVKKEYELCVP